MIYGRGLQQFARRFGTASAGTLMRLRQFEKKINAFDRDFGGVPGDIYRMTPAYATIEPIRQTTKSLLNIGAKVGLGIGEGKPRQAIQGLGEAVDLAEYGAQSKFLSNMIQNPIAVRIYNSPFIQRKLD
jgi:hypothetical protein